MRNSRSWLTAGSGRSVLRPSSSFSGISAAPSSGPARGRAIACDPRVHSRYPRRRRGLAAERAGSPLESLRKLYLAYAQLGLDKPDDYRTLFMTPEAQPARERKDVDDISRENPAFAVSLDRISACVRVGSIAGDVHAVATILWTTVHGAVAALLTFPAFPFGDPHAYLARIVDLAIDMVRAKPCAPLAMTARAAQPQDDVP